MKITLFALLIVVSCNRFDSGANQGQNSDMQTRLNSLEKKFADFEQTRTVCLNDKKKLQEQIDDKEEDLKACPAFLTFKGSNEEKSIGYTLMDIFRAGCSGNIRYEKERFKGDQAKGEVTLIESKVIAKYEHARRDVVFEVIKKEIAPDQFRSPFDRQIDLKLRNLDSADMTSVILGKMYEVNKESSGGTLAKGVYKYLYNVVKNETQELVVTFEGETAEQWNHMPSGEKTKFRFTCNGLSVEGLDNLSAQNVNGAGKEISKKVFGQ